MAFSLMLKLIVKRSGYLPSKCARSNNLVSFLRIALLLLIIPSVIVISLSSSSVGQAQVLDKQAKLAEQTFWIIRISIGSLNQFLSLSVQTRISLRRITIAGN